MNEQITYGVNIDVANDTKAELANIKTSPLTDLIFVLISPKDTTSPLKSFIVTKRRNVIIGGKPVVTKVYRLKFSKTFNSLILFSNSKAKQVFPKGLKENEINSSRIKYKG